MTISPDTPQHTRPGSKRPKHTERDFAQRPEETSARSKGVRVAWVLFLIVAGIAGIYLLVTLFSVAVQMLSDGTPDQAQEREQKLLESQEQQPR